MISKLRLITKSNSLSAIIFKGLSVIKGPALLIMLVAFLTPEQQGYWYLITNLGALAYMADFGLGSLTMQHIANRSKFEHASLNARNSFSKLIRSSYKFLLISLSIICLVLTPAGLFFIESEETLTVYAWFIYIASSLPVHFLLFELFILQGFGGVIQSYRLRSTYVLLSLIICSIMLAFGMSLLSLGVSNLIASVILIPFVYKKFNPVVTEPNNQNPIINTVISNKTRIQYITSWLSGYAMFFMIVPLVMYFEGPVEAGKVGLALALVKAISAMSLAPMESSLTELGKAAGKKDKNQIMHTFKRSLVFGSVIFVLTATMGVLILEVIREIDMFNNRLPSLLVFSSLLLAEFTYFMMSMLAKKVRVFLEEPYAKANVFFAIAVFSNAVFWLYFRSIETWSIMQVFLYLLVGLPLFYKIYLVSMKKYYQT